ncbi:MAG: potassium transporter [Proteobacteria bacterium]|nr:potassium transporter [Pseudomonadota bacterium]
MRLSDRSIWSSIASVANVLGALLMVTGIAMLLPVFCTLFYDNEGDFWPLLSSACIAIFVGGPTWWFLKDAQELRLREAFVVATVGWVIISAFSTLPFLFHGAIPDFTNAFFEMMSGYTTTGATILNDIEALPHGLLLWRSETHFLGGMGFITLAILILPHGISGVRLFRAESSPGQLITGERFKARNRDAVVFLWIVYLVLNVAQIMLMCLGGMGLFDSICHTFGTVSTSGYSTYNASMGHFNNPYFDWITVIFMFLGGMTFVLFYYIYKGNFRALRINTELRWYVGLSLFFSVAISLVLFKHGIYGISDSLRHGTFQTLSILTTTGFSTVDYELWPQSAQMLLFVVCFVGACAGSTTSGIKIIHYVLICKFMAVAIKKLFFQPLTVVSIRINEQRIDNVVIYLALCYFIVNIFLILLGSCVITLLEEIDFFDAISSVVAALMNIGPGFGLVGPTDNFDFFSDASKWFLSLNMLIGRLEMFSALVLIYPSFWRR